MQDFAGIWVPLITPFTDGAVDHRGLRRLVIHLAEAGVAGFVVCGSTGEAATLDDTEQRAVLRAVLDVRSGLPVLMGVSGVAPAAVAEQLRRFADDAPAGFLVPPPSYVRPSQQGIADFFGTLADASPLPLVLYDIPQRTGVRIATATMLALAAHPRIRAVKDCAGDLDHTQAVIHDGRLQLLAGDDHRMFTTMCQGGAGAIAASAHLRPDLFVAMQRHIAAGELPAAQTLWRALWPLTLALFDEPNPAPVKAALAQRHGLRRELRAPMTAASVETTRRLHDLLSRIDAIAAIPTPRQEPCPAD
jgi:4-hydroxy-tetrahydrodipicolinate synthase